MSSRPVWGSLVTFAVVGVVLFITAGSDGRGDPPAVQMRSLTDRPARAKDKEIQFRTSGFQFERGQWVWRPLASSPPTILLRFRGEVPNRLPPRMKGTARYLPGIIHIEDCTRFP